MTFIYLYNTTIVVEQAASKLPSALRLMETVRALVRRLGGVVSLSSEPGEGTTFIVTLPRVLAAPDVGEAA